MFKLQKLGASVWEPTTNEDEVALLEDIQQSKGVITTASVPPEFEAQIKAFLAARDSVQSTVYNSMAKVLASGGVDVVIPVYNAVHLVERCVKSVRERTTHPYKLIIVDDASDEQTKTWLETFAEENPDVTLIRNKKNRGFAATCNRGIRTGENPFVVLLNSDVVVTQGWLLKMVMAMEDNPRNVFVNPCTNNTAMIAVPLKEGASYLDMNRALEITSHRTYPEIMPTGFALMFRRSLIKEIGFIDEGYGSYGEESDYWMKGVKFINPDNGAFPRYRAVLADNCYLFHERGGSFNELGEDYHLKLRTAGSDRFHRIHPEFRAVWSPAHNAPMGKAIKRLAEDLDPSVLSAPNAKYNIAYVVASSSFCGGMKYICDIVNELNERGINAKVVQLMRDPNQKKANPLAELRSAPIVFRSPKDFVTNFSTEVFSNGIVVAATGELAIPVLKLFHDHPSLTPLLHNQSYDVDFCGKDDDRTRTKLTEIYQVFPKQIANAKWVSDQIKSIGAPGKIPFVHPGIEHDIFYPRDREDGDERPTVMIHMNQRYPFKGYERGVEVCKALLNIADDEGKELRIFAAGMDNLPEEPRVIGLGYLTQTRMSHQLGTEVDVNFDPSEFHSYGLPILEGMACGVAGVSWDNDGLREYATSDNCLILPKDMTAGVAAEEIWALLNSKPLRDKLAYEGLKTADKHDRKEGVSKFIDAMEGMLLDKSIARKKIVFVTPHVRKQGGPTTIINSANLLAARGHDVQVCSVYKDTINTDLVEGCRVPMFFGVDNIPECDVLFVPGDTDHHGLLHDLAQAKHHIAFKLSHNPRFKALETEGLTYDYDRIVTSTQWLKEACEKPTEGWNYEPKEATRIGWYNHGFPQFNCPPNSRMYNKFQGPTKVILGGLIHNHPTKGSNELVSVFKALNKKHQQWLMFCGVGESPLGDKPDWFIYHQKLSRSSLAQYMRQIDIWVGASHSEGLGRMALEAMSAGVCCIIPDTGAEYAKHGENCLIYPVGNAQKCAEAVEAVLLDGDLFSNLLVNGYDTAQSLSNPTDYIENLETVIQEVCS